MFIYQTGLRIANQYGNFYESPAGDMEFGTMDADKAISIALEHARTLDDRYYAYIQSAILYTTSTGQRRVRVHNVALRVVTLAGNVFQYADMDATVSHMLREGERSSIHCRTGTDGPGSRVKVAIAEDRPDTRVLDREVFSHPVRVQEVLRRRGRPHAGT